jgi:hypothetical protein
MYTFISKRSENETEIHYADRPTDPRIHYHKHQRTPLNMFLAELPYISFLLGVTRSHISNHKVTCDTVRSPCIRQAVRHRILTVGFGLNPGALNVFPFNLLAPEFGI